MKKLAYILATLFIFLCFSPAAAFNSPAIDVYVLVLDTDTFYAPPAIVEVHLKPNTIDCSMDMCPTEDIRVIGEAFDPKRNFLGMRMVTIEKGYLNDEKHWSYDHPNHKPIEGNNMWLWGA